MRVEIKNPELFAHYIQKIVSIASYAKFSFFKGKLLINGMNPKNTILATIQLSKPALKGIQCPNSGDYSINLLSLYDSIKGEKKKLILDFKGNTLCLTTSAGKISMPCITIQEKYKAPELSFGVSYKGIPCLNESFIVEARYEYPIKIIYKKRKGVVLSMIVAPDIF